MSNELTQDQKELVASIKIALMRSILNLDDRKFLEMIEKVYKEENSCLKTNTNQDLTKI